MSRLKQDYLKMEVEACLLRILNLPSGAQVQFELCHNLLPELAKLVGEYTHQDVFALAHLHFTDPDGCFLSIRDLFRVTSYLYENRHHAKDVTARGPALLWYLLRMVRGMLPMSQWPDRMRDRANEIIETTYTETKWRFRTRLSYLWCFRTRLSHLEDRYTFCDCAECRLGYKPGVEELLLDIEFIETLLDRIVLECVGPLSDLPASKQRMMTDYQAPNLSIGFKFELGCALCQ